MAVKKMAYIIIATLYVAVVLGIARALSWQWHPDGGKENWFEQ